MAKMLRLHMCGYFNTKNSSHWADFHHQLDEITYCRICYDKQAKLNIVRLYYPDAVSIQDGFAMIPEQ